MISPEASATMVGFCEIFCRVILLLADNLAILDAFPDQTDGHQGPYEQFEFR